MIKDFDRPDWPRIASLERENSFIAIRFANNITVKIKDWGYVEKEKVQAKVPSVPRGVPHKG